MYKKLISSILVVALLNLLGCYSSGLVNATEYKQIEEDGKPNEIFVKTKDNQEYHFSESNFKVLNDTLYGKGILLINEEGPPFEGKIALSEIESIQFEGYDLDATLLLLVGIWRVGLIGALFFMNFIAETISVK